MNHVASYYCDFLHSIMANPALRVDVRSYGNVTHSQAVLTPYSPSLYVTCNSQSGCVNALFALSMSHVTHGLAVLKPYSPSLCHMQLTAWLC
jgi:predicted nucleotidyltransferase